ncbi:hypothetical protein CPB84DRAFT_1769803 [Gymnopilus junonius]|uniref:Uncharacterized protein n=1 Tax=Gymnopilus junonius TaxID=109634 RepID=A0A9P5NVQ0_GYMJU|nr:hypothetical protein CPB84DRAFT_1769803 [Gymnopilus junonius]
MGSISVARKILQVYSHALRNFRPQTRCISSSSGESPAPQTTVHKGAAFEQRSLRLLGQSMSMSLKGVGGKEDGGVDLLGWWWLPHDDPATSESSLSLPRRRIRIVGQCKAEKKKLGPNYVRELEGVLYRFLTMSSTIPSVFPSADQSDIPPPDSLEVPQFPMKDDVAQEASETDINFGSAICNPALCGARGLLKGQMEIRWERHHLGRHGRPAVWWNNERLQNKIYEIDTWTPGGSLVTPLADVEVTRP